MITGPKRIGIFSLVIDLQSCERLERELKALFSTVIILDAKSDTFLLAPEGTQSYLAVCDQFDEINEGDYIPQYRAKVNQIQFPDCTGLYVSWEKA